MLFNSISFFVFFPLATFLYFVLPHKYRWAWLLAASSYFYMSFVPKYILILAVVIIVDYIAGIVIASTTGHKKKLILVVSLLTNLGIIFFFKYFNFFNENIAQLAQFFRWNYSIQSLSIILPLGLSFHTFQSMSYTIEVYRGKQKAEKHLGIFALYVMFYPQLVAGPIERAKNLLHQFREKHSWDYQRAANGLKLMAWGLFKKAVIADRLAFFVNEVFNNPGQHHSVSIAIAAIFFTFQIYCDFSGYSDIAIGAAQVMGFSLTDNFKRPYHSKSISEFWTRWHISLSSWFRDYVYIPLGGNRISLFHWCFNIFIVFLLSGIWHGANWTFILWGTLNGIYIIVGRLTKSFRDSFVKTLRLSAFPVLYKYWQIVFTFLLVSFSWIFFRANSLTDAFTLIKSLTEGWAKVNIQDFYLGQAPTEFWIAISAIFLMEILHFIQRHGSIRHMLMLRPEWIRFTIYTCVILMIFLLGVFKNQPFIYFQF